MPHVVVAIIIVLAMMGVGFLAGQVFAPHVLPDLDLDVYEATPVVRVYYWAVLCAVGMGLIGAAVPVALEDHRRKSNSSHRVLTISGLMTLLVTLAVVSLPLLCVWGLAFTPRPSAVRSHCTTNLKSIALAYRRPFGLPGQRLDQA